MNVSSSSALYSVDERFWTGFELPRCPRLDGKAVLEIGAGEGHRCLEMADHGAARVVGVDPFETPVLAARAKLATLPPIFRERVEFVHGTIESLGDQTFDVVVSENALEHVMDVPGLLAEIRRRLRPGGRAYIGFGPLYHAPDGDHGWLRAALPARRFFPWPWGHLLLRRYALRRLSRQHGRPLTAPHDWPYLNLNELDRGDYLRMFKDSGLRIEQLHTNSVRSLKGRAVKLAARLPVVQRYLTLNMFVVLARD